MTVFQHPGEEDVCYVWLSGGLYEVTTEGVGAVWPEDGLDVPLAEYYDAVLDGADEVSLDVCHPRLVYWVDRLTHQDH